jgi:YesN/AraC family two-component response regulator
MASHFRMLQFATTDVASPATADMLVRILIAEDNPMMRRFLARLVAVLSADIRECGDGEYAVELYRSFHPDLVLMDIRMPRMDGLDATRAIMTMDPAAQVLIVTGHDEPNYRRTARDCGAAGYFLKERLQELQQYLAQRYPLLKEKR